MRVAVGGPFKPCVGLSGVVERRNRSSAFARSERPRRSIDQSPRHALLQRLERISERSLLGFADQQVEVFWHDNVAIDPQLETPSDALKRNFKCMLCQCIGERLSATVAAECYKMGLPRLLESFQSPRHRTSLGCEFAPLKPKSGLNGPPGPLLWQRALSSGRHGRQSKATDAARPPRRAACWLDHRTDSGRLSLGGFRPFHELPDNRKYQEH